MNRKIYNEYVTILESELVPALGCTEPIALAYAAAKALREYYPDDKNTEKALSNMERAEWKTRAMRGIQPTWYQYADLYSAVVKHGGISSILRL